MSQNFLKEEEGKWYLPDSENEADLEKLRTKRLLKEFESIKTQAINPKAKKIKEVSDEMIAWKTAGTKLYQKLPADCQATMKEVQPLREIPANRPVREDFYKTLQEMKKK